MPGPMVRCLNCRALVDRSVVRLGRCAPCAAKVKAARNADARAAGSVPAGARCWLCGRGELEGDPMTWDHVRPLSMGGAGGELRPAHGSCNARRGARVRP